MFFRRSRVRRETEKAFPGDNIPTFRNNPEATQKLEKLVGELTKTCAMMEVGFGEGIYMYTNKHNGVIVFIE